MPDLSEVLSCTNPGPWRDCTRTNHHPDCPASFRPAVQAWHEAQVAIEVAYFQDEAERWKKLHDLRKNAADRYVPCPDHRDKVDHRKDRCSVCRAEAAESRVAEMAARIAELEDVLATALPYVESAEADPAYKRGAVATVTKKIRAALPQEGEACGTCADSPFPGMVEAEMPNYVMGVAVPDYEPCPDCGGKP